MLMLSREPRFKTGSWRTVDAPKQQTLTVYGLLAGAAGAWPWVEEGAPLPARKLFGPALAGSCSSWLPGARDLKLRKPELLLDALVLLPLLLLLLCSRRGCCCAEAVPGGAAAAAQRACSHSRRRVSGGRQPSLGGGPHRSAPRSPDGTPPASAAPDTAPPAPEPGLAVAKSSAAGAAKVALARSAGGMRLSPWLADSACSPSACCLGVSCISPANAAEAALLSVTSSPRLRLLQSLARHLPHACMDGNQGSGLAGHLRPPNMQEGNVAVADSLVPLLLFRGAMASHVRKLPRAWARHSRAAAGGRMIAPWV